MHYARNATDERERGGGHCARSSREQCSPSTTRISSRRRRRSCISGGELDFCDRLQPAFRRVAAARRALRQLTTSLEFDEPEGFAPTEPMRRT